MALTIFIDVSVRPKAHRPKDQLVPTSHCGQIYNSDQL